MIDLCQSLIYLRIEFDLFHFLIDHISLYFGFFYCLIGSRFVSQLSIIVEFQVDFIFFLEYWNIWKIFNRLGPVWSCIVTILIFFDHGTRWIIYSYLLNRWLKLHKRRLGAIYFSALNTRYNLMPRVILIAHYWDIDRYILNYKILIGIALTSILNYWFFRFFDHAWLFTSKIDERIFGREYGGACVWAWGNRLWLRYLKV